MKDDAIRGLSAAILLASGRAASPAEAAVLASDLEALTCRVAEPSLTDALTSWLTTLRVLDLPDSKPPAR